MTKFQIQIRNPGNGQWETQQTITPAYTFSILRMRRYLFLHVKVGIIANLTKAERFAHKQAVRLAKKMYWRLPCRVQRFSMWNAVERKDIIWQNGKAVLSEGVAAA